ncbi:hypothetical protein U5A82_19595 [Sphingobium sp. CR2-8]|uniref:hypothetical protein n=1 Tax=Sphingobium sp. CR2-8 TaxID=1306534 RepID=UPI002DBE4A6C|nr:hypothetical protein [Sphingobium sp. CR2-8]MEC3912597.1 hypothetical protein [Sphingobium sp. CR2-8]
MANDLKETLPTVFPVSAVEAVLERWWDDETADAALPGDKPASSDIMKPAVEIDSHRAVRALVTLEEVVKFQIPESAIKEGGYDSFEEMKEHLIPRIAALFEKEKKKENA